VCFFPASRPPPAFPCQDGFLEGGTVSYKLWNAVISAFRSRGGVVCAAKDRRRVRSNFRACAALRCAAADALSCCYAAFFELARGHSSASHDSTQQS
jgi:hypothetical protein